MSGYFSWQHAVRKSKLEPTTKLVLYTIATYMAADGSGCFPSYGTIAESSGLGRSTVIAHVKKSIEAGFLGKETRFDDDGEYTSNLYQPMMPNGSPLAGPPRPAPAPRVVHQRDPKKPSEQTKEHSPQPPEGAVRWEDNPDFMKLVEAYTKLNPSRVDSRKAWAVWLEKGLSGDAEQLLAALPVFALTDQWKKEAGRFIPSLSKWLEDGAWRNGIKVSVQVSAEELAERARIGRAGRDAYSRLVSNQKLGLPDAPEELEAVRLWRAQQSNQ